MELSKRFITAKAPCASGLRWFLRRHPDGSDYQPTLDALVADGRIDDACWLLTQFGPTREVLRLDELVTAAIVFAGSSSRRSTSRVGPNCVSSQQASSMRPSATSASRVGW